MKQRRRIVAWALSLLATVAVLFGVTTVAYAAVSGAPDTDKSLLDNGDGTYTLSLSVTGAAEQDSTTQVSKANVVLVVDTSNSMNQSSGATAPYEYTEYTGQGQQGGQYWGTDGDGDYYRVYWRNNAWRTSNNNNASLYSGTVYTRSGGGAISRLEAEKDALTKTDGIIDKLLEQNVPGDSQKSDIIEVGIVNFDTRGHDAQSPTTNATQLKNTINGLTTSSGTNWEEGLQYAKSMADTFKRTQPNEDVYVIFLTDGEPTTHNGSYNVNINYAYEWGQARDDARGIVTAGYHFYALFTWGSGNSSHYLSSLVQYAYTGAGDSNSELQSAYQKYFTDASDTDTLINALEQIVHDITTSVGYTNVELEDGVTSMTASNVKATAGGEVTGLRYYRSGGSYGEADPDKGNYGTEWTDAPPATVNSDGEVDWNLGNLVLEDGVTYTVTFVVWPSQESLDLVADLNNGVVSYDSLTDDQKSQISVSGGKYSLKTNTDYPTVTYSTVTTTTVDGETTQIVSDPQTARITNPDPVGLAEGQLNAVKSWEDTLDPSQREEIDDVVLYLKLDGHYYYVDEDGEPMGVTLTEDSEWTITDYISIAPGLMVTSESPAYPGDDVAGVTYVTWKGTKYALLETGHEYVFEESDINNHFELTAYTHHPMIMGENEDGSPHIVDVVFTKDASGNITGIESVSDLGDNLSATNTLKGGINITKKVVDETGAELTDCTDAFDVTVTVTDPDGQPLLTKKTADGTEYTIDYRIYYGENNPAYATSGDQHRSDHIYKTGTEFTETIYVGDTIRVVNVEEGSLFEVVDENGNGYVYDHTAYQIAYGTEGPADYGEDEPIAVHGNSASYAEVTNKVVSGDLEITKDVENEITSPDTTKFEFTVELKDATGEPIEGEFSYTIGETTGTIESGGTLKLADGEKATISKIPAGATYTVTETPKSGYTTTVDGDETNEATGTITAGDTATAAFTNTYSVTPVIVDPPVQKVITGNNDLYNGGDFTFVIANTEAPEGVTAPMPENTEITNSEDHELPNKPGFYEFGEIEFDVPGTYVYTVTESGSAPGVTNDEEATKTITFVVEDNRDGTLKVTPASADAVFTFTNVYKDGELDITKTVVNADNPDDTTKFTFTVTFEGVAEGAEFSYTIGETTGTISSGGTLELGNGETAKITGIPAGATYEVEEDEVDNYTMTNSSNTSGTIKADETVTASFENTHDTGKLVVTKTVSGAFSSVDDLPDGFTISINRADGTTYKTITKADLVAGNGRVTLTDVPAGSYTASESNAGIAGYDLDTTGINTAATVEKDTDGAIDITNTYTRQTGSLTVTKALAGDLTDLSALSDNFTITVTGPEDSNWTITKEQLVAGNGSVTLTDVPTGTYSADESGQVVSGYTVVKSYSGDATVTKGETATITITNTYTSAPISTDITAKKVLNGATLAAGQFSFELAGGPLEAPLTATNAADGTVTFGSVSFTEEGEYTFTITEVEGDKDYITYSDASYTVTVVVEANKDGSLKVASKTGDGESAVFTNTYSATGMVDPSVKKTLNGRDLVEGEFSFELSGDSLETPLTATNAADGSVTFDTIEYTLEDVKADVEAGVATQNDDGTYTYTYTIEETSTDGSGVTVDTKSITLTVTLTDDGKGNLTANPTYSDNGEFVNTYKASGEITFEGTKSLKGREMTDDDVFTFAIYEGETLVAECKNDGTGKINYPTISYAIDGAEGVDDTGTHTYTVKETSTDGNGITVDTQTYTVTVEVSDKGDGTLDVTSENATGIDFVNTYDADPITIVPTAKKQLSGASLEEGQFTFQLLDENGSMIEETKNTALGQVAFSAITYELEDVGTHTYTIKEVDDGQDYITYDGTEVTLTVVVTDNGNGTLNADVSYSPSNTFKNTYHKPEVGLEVTKTVTSKPANGSYYKAGETVSYKIVVTNTGEVALTDVKVADDLTDEKWTIDELKAGASETFTTTYKVTDKDVKAGSVLNVATAEADNPVDPDKPLKDKDNKKVPTGSDKNPPKKKIIPQTNDITPTGAMATMTIFGVAAVTAGTVLQRRKRK